MINILLPRLDPAYMYYYIHWTRLLTTGIVPFTYLVYMNMRIYCRHAYYITCLTPRVTCPMCAGSGRTASPRCGAGPPPPSARAT